MNRRYLGKGMVKKPKTNKQTNNKQTTEETNQSKTKQIKTKQTHSFIKTIVVSKEGSLGITSARALHTRGRNQSSSY